MINRGSHACFYVLDQQRAKEFHTEKLGFEVRSDVTMGGRERSGGRRGGGRSST